MELMVDCPKCHQWKIESSDRFCSWCGIKLVNVEIKPDKMRFYIDKEKNRCTHANTIVLDNSSGWTDVKGTAVAYDKSIFNISQDVEVIRQGDKEKLMVELVDPVNIQPGTSSHIMAEVAGEKQSISVEFYYTPQWIMELDSEKIESDGVQKLYKFPSTPFNEVNFKIARSAHTIFHTDDVYTDDDRYEIEVTGKSENFIAGVLKIDNERLEVGMEEYVELKIKGKNTEFEARFPFYIQLVIPPDFYLMIDGLPYKEGRKEEIEIYEGIENEIELKIINSSNEKLTIANIVLDPPFCTDELPIDFPKELSEGKDVVLKLKMDPAAMTGEKMEACITINTHEIKEKKIEFIIEKNVAREFEGFLAVDFGTTNTTVAYKLPGGKCRYIPLEKAVDKEKALLSPSVIRYEKITNGVPEKYVIGERAKGLLILDPASSVMSVKTSLGAKEKLRILPVDEGSGSVYFTPLEVTLHMIARLKEICEQHLRKKISNAVITHPSKFTPIQIEELKDAFKKAGIEAAEVIEEPHAAALDYIVQGREKECSSYVIGVFDCGGGTTDITMIAVKESEGDRQRVLDVTVLATDGDSNFGGNNLTDIVMEIMAEKINKKQIQISPEDLNLEELKLFYREEDERKEKMIKVMVPKGINWEKIVRVNRNNLWARAEACKIQLSDIETSEIDMSIGLQMVTAKDELEPVDVTVNVKKQEFENQIHDKILELVEKLKRMKQKTGKEFDLILLSGMSSQIPLIHQIFSENFSDPIHFAPDLKKCVVSGALDFYELVHGVGSLELVFEVGRKLRSAIGIPITTIEGKRKFLEVFPHGTHLPTEPVKIDFPLKRRVMLIAFRNNGTHEYFDEAPNEFEVIKKVDMIVPDDITDEQLKDVELYMNLNENLSPGFSIRLGNFYREFY